MVLFFRGWARPLTSSEQHSLIPCHMLKLGQDRFGVAFRCSRYPLASLFDVKGPPLF